MVAEGLLKLLVVFGVLVFGGRVTECNYYITTG